MERYLTKMSNYKIIYDEDKLDSFIEEFLPTINISECYYFQLFGRKKYLPAGTIQSGHHSLHRFVCKKERIKEKLKQLEVPLGTYLNRSVELPQECLAIYMAPNPRCHEKAAKALLIELAKRVTTDYDNYNTHQLAMTQLHKSCSKKYFVDFDFDELDFDSISDKIYQYINKESLTLLKTRGGFHLLVNTAKVDPVYKNLWYQNIRNLGADVVGDDLIPVPGCCQGGFVPHFVDL
jgi:hypothetical protein